LLRWRPLSVEWHHAVLRHGGRCHARATALLGAWTRLTQSRLTRSRLTRSRLTRSRLTSSVLASSVLAERREPLLLSLARLRQTILARRLRRRAQA